MHSQLMKQQHIYQNIHLHLGHANQPAIAPHLFGIMLEGLYSDLNCISSVESSEHLGYLIKCQLKMKIVQM
jgi:hypothetical protein